MSTTLVSEIAASHDVFLEPLTVHQYHAMMKAGILTEGAPVELIDGLLVHKDRRDAGSPNTTVGTLHSSTVTKLAHALAALLAGQPFHVRTQQPATLSGSDEPEPDIAVVRGTLDDFRTHHPGPAEVMLVVEVADSSLSYDRTTKRSMYAQSGIPEYWIVDLTKQRLEVCERPNTLQERYESVVSYGASDVVRFTIGALSLELSVADVL